MSGNNSNNPFDNYYPYTPKCKSDKGNGCPINLSPKRGVEFIRELANALLLKDASIDKITKKNLLKKINVAYEFCKDKFSEKYRETGERYFDHLVSVSKIILEKLEKPNLEKVLIAILHDIVEDTDIDFHTLRKMFGSNLINNFGAKIAIGVQAISKKKPFDYVDNEEDKTFLIESGILDEDNDLKNEITKKAKKKELTFKEQMAFDIFLNYKNERNNDYFFHMQSFDSMFGHVKSIALKNRINLSEEELKEITKNTLDVKFADRIHNLKTQWNPDNIKKVLRKIKETKKYILPIAKETNPEAYKLLCEEIEKLEKKEIYVNGELIGVLGEINGKLQKILIIDEEKK